MLISGGSLRYRKKRQMLLFLVFGLFCLLFMRGMQLHMKNAISLDRIRVHAIPTALSVLYHKHPHDYTGLRAIAMPFQGPGSPSELIHAAKRQNLGEDRSIYYWVADDKGLEDYVIAAFALFGAHVNSLYYLWFLVLLASLSLFLVSFNRQLGALGFLCLTLLGIHLAISTLPLCKIDLANLNVPAMSIYEPRVFDILALPPIIHLLLLAAKRGALRWLRDILPLMGQLFIFIALYHARSSLGWEIVAVFAFCMAVIGLRLYRKSRKNANRAQNSRAGMAPAIVVAAFLMLALLSLNIYKHRVYNPRYFVDQGQRTIWHNALMGLGQEDKFFATQYNLAVNDGLIAQSVIDFARKTNKCTPDIALLEAQQLLNAAGDHGEINWYNYENCAKSFYFSIVSANKLETAFLYAVKKPYISLHNLKGWMRELKQSELKMVDAGSEVGWHPLNAVNFSLFLVILMLSSKAIFKMRAKLMLMTLVVLACSLIPSVAFYQSLVTQGGMLVFAAVLLYLSLAFCLRQGLDWLTKK